MRYVIDRMTMADIPRITEIEKLAYESPWPTSAYRKELQENRWAHYIVARDTWMTTPERAPEQATEPPRRAFPLSLLPARPSNLPPAPHLTSIVGFAGLWLMMDEAHITTIATHPTYRRRYVGELLLASLINLSLSIRAQRVTLEVRVSNTIAQNLYRKYGFQDVGLRKRYYSDNHEDARLMSTPAINAPSYQERFLQLKTALTATLEAENPDSGQAAHA